MDINVNEIIQLPNVEEFIIDDSSDENQEHEPNPSELNVGLMQEAFVILKTTGESNKKNLKPTLCSLLVGEVKLTQKCEEYKGKVFGYTEGIGSKPSGEPKKMASKAVIFMVISQNENWKIPIGLFFVHNPDIIYFSKIIKETLKKITECGIKIISITLNCTSPHFSFALAEELGAAIDISKPFSTFKTYFQHPATSSKVYILYDLDILIGCLKCYWSAEKIICHKSQKLDYNFCTNVQKIEESELQKYSQNAVFDWIIIRKRINYDTDNIGRNIADAIDYLKDIGHPEFQDCGPTVQFLKILDFVSKISKINGQIEELYPHLAMSNEKDWISSVNKILIYVKHLKSLNQETPEHLSIFKTYIVGITVYFLSLLGIYHMYILNSDSNGHASKSMLPHLLPSKFCLKHLRFGQLGNVQQNEDITALWMFKNIKMYTSYLQHI